MIQLHRLEGFYWVVRSGGYARAARDIPYPITQPALHQQVRKLEAELDLTLLERAGKDRMLPTPAGRRLFEFVAPFFEQLPAVVRALKSGDYGGELHIAAEPLMLRWLLPAWLGRLERKRPGVRVELRELAANDAAPVRNGQADVLVCWLPTVPDDVATMRVGVLRPFLVLPRRHALARRRTLSPRDLEQDTFVCYVPGVVAHDLQMRALQSHGVRPSRTLAAGSADTILGLVESGLGWSIVPSLDANGPRSKGVAAVPLLPKVEFEVVAAWRKDAPENPLLDAFLETAPRP